MKFAFIIAFILLSCSFIYGQHNIKQDTIVPGKGNRKEQLKEIKEKNIKYHSDTTGNQPKACPPKDTICPVIDSTIQNKYGDLLRDDKDYNKRYALWKPFAGVTITNMLLNVADRYLLNLSFADISLDSWKRNLNAGFPWGRGWEWDKDRFANNFISHPLAGAFYFNASRSDGYGFYVSSLFSLYGSYQWKIFGENGTPEREDPINTTFTGIFVGEILYRLSSNILDDRTVGTERVIREIGAGIVDPVRGVNRLLQGKTFRHTNREVYEKEPINVSIFAGVHLRNDLSSDITQKADYSSIINAQLDYGNPFEICKRQPYDFFKLRAEVNFGVGRKWFDNLTGYGVLFGKNVQLGNLDILIGGFQYYDYWDNTKYEIGTIGLGGGAISKLPLTNTSSLYTSIHLALVPFGGNSTELGPILTQTRDYNFVCGYETKFESTINLGKYMTASLMYYFYEFSTIDELNNKSNNNNYVNKLGDNYINIIKPRITVSIYKNVSIGVEEYLYYSNRYLQHEAPIYSSSSVMNIFLQIYLEDPQRRGHFN